MSENDIQLKLLANVPIDITNECKFNLPTILELVEMGESQYQYYISILLFTKESLKLDTMKELASFSDYDVLMNIIYYDDQFRETFLSALGRFLSCKPDFFDGAVFLGDLTEENLFTEEKWMFIKKLLKIGNFLPENSEDDEYKAGNERAKKFMEKLKKRKAEVDAMKKKTEKVNLHSIISAVGWRLDDVDKVLNKTIYQLYDAYYRFGFIDNFNFINTGIYTGNIDSSKIKLPDINWANIIKIK